MADVDVERKGPSIWPWIIGLIVLALLIWALVELFEDDTAAVTDPVMEQPPSVEVRPEIGPATPTDTAIPDTITRDPTGAGAVVPPPDRLGRATPAGVREPGPDPVLPLA